jgi:hypothetical protein
MAENIESVKILFKTNESGGGVFGQILATEAELSTLVTEKGYADLPGAKGEEGTLRLPRIFAHNSWKAGKWTPKTADIPYIPAPVIGDVWLCNLNYSAKTGVLVAIPLSYVEFRGVK